MFGFKKKRKLTLEEKLRSLEEVGVVREAGSVEDLLESFGRDVYEEDGYENLVSALANEVETGPEAGKFYTRQLFELDTECIAGDGDYSSIANRFAEMFRDELEICSVEDKVDWDEQTAELSFVCNGKRYSIKPKFRDDWFDERVLGLFVQVCEDFDSRKKIWFAPPDSQSMRLCVMTPAQMKAFNRLTGMRMRVLTVQDF